MWSHYANGFKGCVLIYELKNGEVELKKHILSDETFSAEIQDVNYSDNVNQIDLWNLISTKTIPDASFFFTKNKHWEYELESRIVLLAQMQSAGEVLHHDASLVKGVIFGSRCDSTFKNNTLKSLKENRIYSKADDLLCFESALNVNNEITLTSGYTHKTKDNKQKEMKPDEVAAWNSQFHYPMP